MNPVADARTRCQAPSSDRNTPFLLCVTGGKGGVGKTCVSANLALALRSLDLDVLLVDLDLGLANVDVLFGLDPSRSVRDHLLSGIPLEECLVQGPRELPILPAASGFSDMATASPEQIERILGSSFATSSATPATTTMRNAARTHEQYFAMLSETMTTL